MSKNILVVAAVVSVGVYKFISHQGSLDLPENRISSPPASLVKASALGDAGNKWKAEVMPAGQGRAAKAEIERRGLRREIQELSEDLSLRQRSLAAKRQDLERSRLTAGDRAPAASAATATAGIASRNEELRSLSNNLNEMRISRGNIQHQEDYAIRVRENATKQAVSKLDFSLQRMEQWSANAKNQLERWVRDHVLGSNDVAHHRDLENSIVQQQVQIDSLREQRMGLTDEHHRRANNIYNLGQQAREDLRGKEQNVRGQMFSLENEIRGIESTQAQERTSRTNESSRFQQAQRDLQAEADQVKFLEASLQAKQAILNDLD